jgi:hypothetical protein
MKGHIGPRFACGFPRVWLHNEIMQAGVIQNRDNENVRYIGQGKARRRKYKELKLGGGHVYDRSSV